MEAPLNSALEFYVLLLHLEKAKQNKWLAIQPWLVGPPAAPPLVLAPLGLNSHQRAHSY